MTTNLSKLEYVVTTVVGSLDLEASNLSEDKFKMLTGFLAHVYFNYKLHTIFAPRVIGDLTDDVFSDPVNRDFILSLTDRINIMLSLGGIDHQVLAEQVVKGFCSGRVADSIIPAPVIQAIFIEPGEAVEILTKNAWLFTIILVILFFNRTVVFSKLSDI